MGRFELPQSRSAQELLVGLGILLAGASSSFFEAPQEPRIHEPRVETRSPAEIVPAEISEKVEKVLEMQE